MKVAVVTDDAALRDLEPEWRALWIEAPDPTPFQSPDWMLSWWSCFGTGRPVVAIARDGLLACYLLGKKLLPMGVGLTDYQDMLLRQGASGDVPLALLGAVLETARAQGAAQFHLANLPPSAALRAVPTPRGWRDHRVETEPCPVLSLPAGVTELRGAVGAGRARDVRQARHRAERAGGWAITEAGSDGLHEALAALAHLHARRWESRGQPGVFDDPRVRAFHRLAAPRLMRAGLLRLALLRIGGELAASCYALLGPGRLFLYLSGFDPKFRFESPGTILLGHMIEEALREGRREIHFLRGSEAYKRAWGGVPRMNVLREFVPA
jgi:CelD/BcsL family acetyltransferase involved in cellulose biosynthesis